MTFKSGSLLLSLQLFACLDGYGAELSRCEAVQIYADPWDAMNDSPTAPWILRLRTKSVVLEGAPSINKVMKILDSEFTRKEVPAFPRVDAHLIIDCHRLDGSIDTYVADHGRLQNPPRSKAVPIDDKFRALFTLDKNFEARIRALK